MSQNPEKPVLVEEAFVNAADQHPVLRIVPVKKEFRKNVGNKYAAFIDIGGTAWGDDSGVFVVPMSLGSLREIMTQVDKIRQRFLFEVHPNLSDGGEPISLRTVEWDEIVEQDVVVEMCPFSGVVLTAASNGEEGVREIMEACIAPSMFTTNRQRDAIMRGVTEIAEGVIRTLSGVFIFDNDFGARQVNYWDAYAMTPELTNAGVIGRDVDYCPVREVATIMPPDGAEAVLSEIWANREVTKDVLPEHLHEAYLWGEGAFDDGHVHLTIVDQSDVIEGGTVKEIGTFADDNKRLFKQFWHGVLRDLADGVIDQVMVNRRLFTSMKDVETGLPVKRLSSFVLNSEGMQPIPKDILKHAFTTHCETGEPLDPTTDIVYQDFAIPGVSRK